MLFLACLLIFLYIEEVSWVDYRHSKVVFQSIPVIVEGDGALRLFLGACPGQVLDPPSNLFGRSIVLLASVCFLPTKGLLCGLV